MALSFPAIAAAPISRALARFCIAASAIASVPTSVAAHQWRPPAVYQHAPVYRHVAYRPLHSFRRHWAYRAAPAYGPPFSATVVDANTGRTLYAVADNELRHPASITKVMTLYLLFEQLEKGRLTPESPIVMSEHAASQAPSKLGLAPGESLTVDEAIKAIVTRSANDVAVAIAEKIGGDEETFAEMMTRKAHALGMTRTVYHNASGLPDDGQVTTAHDLTILARAIEEHFPHYFHYFSTHSFEFAGETVVSHNHLIGRVDGVDGIKTGYTNASGFNLLTSMHLNGRSLVAVVLGGRSAAARDQLMEQLLYQHFAQASAGGHTAPMIADASAPEPPQVAEAGPRRSPSAALAMPLPPVRESAEKNEDEAEGDNDETPARAAPVAPARAQVADRQLIARDAPATAFDAGAGKPIELIGGVKGSEAIAQSKPSVLPASEPKPIETEISPSFQAVAADPAALGWVKGPDGAIQPPKSTGSEEEPTGKTSLKPNEARAFGAIPPAKTFQTASNDPAALGWVKGPDPAVSAKSAAAVKPQTESKATARPVERPVEESGVAKSEETRTPAHDGWVVQIGATDDADKATDMLNRAKAQNRGLLAMAKPFTERVQKGDSTFYRARFAVLDSAAAEAACRSLKRSGFSCFAMHD
jgi:D-alanyl-D-alanine carboxypeptidase